MYNPYGNPCSKKPKLNHNMFEFDLLRFKSSGTYSYFELSSNPVIMFQNKQVLDYTILGIYSQMFQVRKKFVFPSLILTNLCDQKKLMPFEFRARNRCSTYSSYFPTDDRRLWSYFALRQNPFSRETNQSPGNKAIRVSSV